MTHACGACACVYLSACIATCMHECARVQGSVSIYVNVHVCACTCMSKISFVSSIF